MGEKSCCKLLPYWGWLVALGLSFIVFGLIGLGMSFYLTLASVYLFGFLLIVASLCQLALLLSASHWRLTLWHALIALLYLAVGIGILKDPLIATGILTLIIASALIAVGVSRVLIALSMKGDPQWGWLCLAGMASLCLGILTLLHWPSSAVWFIGLYIAVEMLVHGWSLLILGCSLKTQSSNK